MYNLTAVEASNNLYEFAVGMNDLSGGLIGALLLFAILIVMFIMGKRREDDMKKVAIFASAITMLVGIIFWATGFIGWKIVIWPILILIASIIIWKFS